MTGSAPAREPARARARSRFRKVSLPSWAGPTGSADTLAGETMRTRDPDLWPGPRDDAGVVRRVALALLPLRAFLGFTFCFAGLQKLANPGFFDASNPASIQAQLAAAVRSSPVHALIAPLAHQPVALGVLIACGELAVGL